MVEAKNVEVRSPPDSRDATSARVLPENPVFREVGRLPDHGPRPEAVDGRMGEVISMKFSGGVNDGRHAVVGAKPLAVHPEFAMKNLVAHFRVPPFEFDVNDRR